jgi:serine/threonine protein kinase
MYQSFKKKKEEETIKETKILQKSEHQNIIKFIEFFILKKDEIIYLNIITKYADDDDLSEK